MKVIHLISGGDTGGAKTHVAQPAANTSTGPSPPSWSASGTAPLPRRPASLGIPTQIMAGNTSCATLPPALEPAYPGGGLCQVIHCHGSRANMMGALLRRGHRAAGGDHRPQRLQAGLPGPSLQPPHLRQHQLLGPAAAGLPHRRVRRHGGPADLPGLCPRPVLHHLQRHRLHPHAPRPRTGWSTCGPWGLDVDEDCGGGRHCRPAQPRQGHVHPDPGLCRGLPASAPICAWSSRATARSAQMLGKLARGAWRGAGGVLCRVDLRRHGPLLSRPGHQHA